MSQQQNKYQPSSASKYKTEDLGLNVDDLLDESDEDDDDNFLEDDEIMEKFKQKAGLTKNTYESSAHKVTQQKEQYSYLTALNEKEEINKQMALLTQAKQSNSGKAQAKETGSKTQYAGLELSSDSESEEDIDQFIQQTKGMKGPVTTNNSNSTNTAGSFEKKQEILASDKTSVNYESDNLQESKLLFTPQNMDIIDVIEKNEKMNEVGPDKIMDNSNQLLSFDNKFYNVNKKLFDYNDYPDIARKLHQQKNHQFQGMVSAITAVQNYLFVGNSTGIIRVFDTKSQKEMKPLMDESTIGQNKVTSIDISDDGGYLISGYKKGQVALWDLVNYKLIRYIQDIHQSDVVNAKIYHMDEGENLYAVSSEDSGKVQLIKYSKKSFLGGYSSEAQFLFKTRLKGTASIAVQRKNEIYPHPYCDSSSLVAFGSLNEIVVCSMRPIKEVFQLNRPTFCKEKSIPYIDWGYGLTPSQRERTVPILAFAWDRLIQLIYINEQTQTIELDGFYYSDSEINSLYFMGDSILFALVNGREVKVLYTTKFYPGHFKFLENAKKDDLLNNQFEKVISVTSHAELEKGFEISDIKTNLLQSQMVMNFNQSVRKSKNQIFFMCGKSISRGKLFTWREYLDHIKHKENYDWLTVLKVALEIYNGDTKGYCKVPDEKEIREGLLKSFMKDMIKDSVNQVIYKYAKNGPGKEETKKDNYQAEAIAIKVAIEFCLSINSTFFLFTEVYQIFSDAGLENKFIANLEPFILSGSFRKVNIPENITKKIIGYYEERNNLKALEKVIQQMDLSDYSQKEELMVTCQVHCLIGALLYLMSNQAEENSLGCMQILNTLLSLMRKAQIIEITKEDIMDVSKVDSSRKYKIEKSRAYIGYKLLWIIKMFLDGKTFPHGFLPKEKQKMHVYDIVNFVTNELFLEELLQFDSEAFFKVIAKIFSGQPMLFLKQQKEETKGYNICLSPEVIINELLLKKSESNPVRLENFYKFVVMVQSQQALPENPAITIDYQLVYKAVLHIITSKEDLGISEEVLINAIKSKKFKKEDIDRIISQLDMLMKPLPLLRIFLVEKKKDWISSFKLNLTNAQLRKNIFSWINKTLDALSRNGKTLKPYNDLKEAIQNSVKELITINVGECVQLLDKWFEDSYQEQLILDELAGYPQVQFDYLKKFLKENENTIQQVINEATYSSDRKAESHRYLQYLILHTKLLCQFEKDKVHEYVKKDYYPINECLDICKQYDAHRAIAFLLKRNGNFLEAIHAFLNIAETIDIVEIMKELVSSTKGQSTSQIQQFRWEFLQCQKLPHVHEFDILIRKALNIATKQDATLGEEGWFVILEYLAGYRQRAQDKIQQKVKNADKSKIDRVKDFVSQRKNYILKIVPTTIKLQTLTERLNLDFKSIKQLYDYKVKDVRYNEKYLKLAKNLQEKELISIQQQLFTLLTVGLQLKEDQKCFACGVQIALSITKTPFKLYNCAHSFHQICLKEKKCPLCVKQTIVLKNKNDLRKSKVSKKGDSSKKAASKEKDIQSMAEQAFQQSAQEKGDNSKQDELLKRRLEVFDQGIENFGLQKSSFN